MSIALDNTTQENEGKQLSRVIQSCSCILDFHENPKSYRTTIPHIHVGDITHIIALLHKLRSFISDNIVMLRHRQRRQNSVNPRTQTLRALADEIPFLTKTHNEISILQ